MAILSALLYYSYRLYNFHTYRAMQMFDGRALRIDLAIHYSLFFLAAIVLRFDPRIVSAIRRRTVRVDFVQLGTFFLSLMVLLALELSGHHLFLYLSCFIAFLTGFFLTESFRAE